MVQTTITRLVISWSIGFTQHRPIWWCIGPLGSHNTEPPGDLLVFWVHTTITRLVISWSLWFTQQSLALVISWSFGFTKHWTTWWSPGLLGSHNTDPPGYLLVLWVHTTITRLVISWSLVLTQNEVARLFTWNSIKVHVLGCCCVANRIIFACRSNTKLGVTYATKHMWQSSVPSTYPVQIGDPHLEIFPSISSLKAMLPCSCMVSSLLVPY